MYDNLFLTQCLRAQFLRIAIIIRSIVWQNISMHECVYIIFTVSKEEQTYGRFRSISSLCDARIHIR